MGRLTALIALHAAVGLGALVGAVDGHADPIYRCRAEDGRLLFQATPCPEGTTAEPVVLHRTHFDAEQRPAVAPFGEGDGDPPAPPPRDPGDDLVTWEELQCHGFFLYPGWLHPPVDRERGAFCHRVTRTATRRERCRELGARHDHYRDSTMRWTERRQELIDAKEAMREVGCCVHYSPTSLGSARADACAGPKAFPW